uniref:NAD(P)-binding domain-containing protein n=1 Tax=Aegilops tauschii TaxID=37682 RepID=M8C7H7_AEGTA
MCRVAASNWSGEGSFLFTSSTAVYDCNDNGFCGEDAASLGIAIMKRRLRGRVFVGCDNQPLSRQEIMDRVNRSGKFDGKFEGFTGTDGPLGKRMDNSKTRAEIGWEPKYPSFTEFLGLSN